MMVDRQSATKVVIGIGMLTGLSIGSGIEIVHKVSDHQSVPPCNTPLYFIVYPSMAVIIYNGGITYNVVGK